MNLSIVVHKRNYINSKSIEQNSFENGSSRERESGNWNGNFEVTVTPLSLPIWTFSLRYIDDREDIRALCNTFAETLPTFIFHAGKIEKQTRWKKQDCQPRGKVTRGISNKMYENTAEVQPREFRFHVAWNTSDKFRNCCEIFLFVLFMGKRAKPTILQTYKVAKQHAETVNCYSSFCRRYNMQHTTYNIYRIKCNRPRIFTEIGKLTRTFSRIREFSSNLTNIAIHWQWFNF